MALFVIILRINYPNPKNRLSLANAASPNNNIIYIRQRFSTWPTFLCANFSCRKRGAVIGGRDIIVRDMNISEPPHLLREILNFQESQVKSFETHFSICQQEIFLIFTFWT
eukprot:sb/3477225/